MIAGTWLDLLAAGHSGHMETRNSLAVIYLHIPWVDLPGCYCENRYVCLCRLYIICIYMYIYVHVYGNVCKSPDKMVTERTQVKATARTR